MTLIAGIAFGDSTRPMRAHDLPALPPDVPSAKRTWRIALPGAGMLATGTYPPSLKQRIASRFGHLANEAAAQLLASLDCSRLQHLIAAHLSQQNNVPALARAALASALGCAPEWIGVATQDEGFGWREI